MPDYQEGKIYKLVSSHTDQVYIGSTTQKLNIRLSGHESDFNRNMKKSSEKLIRYCDCKIELLEKFPCKNDKELRKREQYWINKYPNVSNFKNAYSKLNKLQGIIQCDCGKILKRCSLENHKKTKEHKNKINFINENHKFKMEKIKEDYENKKRRNKFRLVQKEFFNILLSP